jgi:hypothetical protein
MMLSVVSSIYTSFPHFVYHLTQRILNNYFEMNWKALASLESKLQWD